MKLQTSSGRLKKPRLLVVRRVVGSSMLPTLKPGQIVIGIRPRIIEGRLVIAVHKDKEIVKRLTKIDGNKIYIIGDNPDQSSDSRNFGWINKNQLLASVIWPRNL
ncbi:MAG: S24 family peptidase [Candidatus Saccharibacteria bacterium]